MEELLSQFSEKGKEIVARFPPTHPRDWLRECALRKREIDRLEYLKWLRTEREVSIKGLIGSNEGSPAYLQHNFRLDLLRHEIQEAEQHVQNTTEKDRIRKDVMRLLMAGKLEPALTLTYKFLTQDDEHEDYQFELVHLISEFNHYEEKERKSLLPHEQLRVARNHIRNALLQIIKEIER